MEFDSRPTQILSKSNAKFLTVMVVRGKPESVAQMTIQCKSRLKDNNLGSFYFIILECLDWP